MPENLKTRVGLMKISKIRVGTRFLDLHKGNRLSISLTLLFIYAFGLYV